MAENFKTKTAAPKKKAPAKAKPKAPSSKADSLRQMREKSASGSEVSVVTATGGINTNALKTIEDFFQAGQVVWRRTVDSIFEMSKIVDLAYDRLPREDYKTLLARLHISESSANQLRKITEGQRMIALHEQGQTLPASTHTLYLLSAMPDEDFAAFTKEHDIDADIRVEDVRKFLQERSAGKKTPPANTKQAEDEAKRQLANDTTAPTGPIIDGDYTVTGEGGEAGEVGSFSGQTTGEVEESKPEVTPPSPAIDAVSPAVALHAALDAVLLLDVGPIVALTADDVRAASEKAERAKQHLGSLISAFEENLFERA